MCVCVGPCRNDEPSISVAQKCHKASFINWSLAEVDPFEIRLCVYLQTNMCVQPCLSACVCKQASSVHVQACACV